MAGRSVIVTGAGGGIGRAVALRFARSHDKLILTDESAAKGDALRIEIEEAGGTASFIEADLHKKLDVHNILAEALDVYGEVNVLAHCASHFYAAPFLETTNEDFDRVLDRNLRAAFLLNRAVAKQIIRQAGAVTDGGVDTARSGAIVNVVSTEAVTASADHALFAASQGGILQMTRAVAMTLSPYGARANAVGVAAIKEELEETEIVTSQEKKDAIAATPLARRGEPEEAAGAVHFLAAGEASFITGQTLFVDGGRLASHVGPKKEH
ncbi:SDR family NAD(P)-dependent oxidoreductase [Parvularcula oceani]|uniref:SDR family NAD(P)-dependent oxidoreductase n=1 Tax=Parvularcula oceani TaxID=1247963 RepID=UPI0004E1FDDE|nr:SDR family oxidoreductase [Parvularcula oceani]